LIAIATVITVGVMFNACSKDDEDESKQENNSQNTPPEKESAGKAVDLGLSVKWADMNVGATTPEDYGDYFAWGETKPKEIYNWSTYTWCEGSRTTLTKYCNNNSKGIVDNKTSLELADDAARANWGGTWRMPTYDELCELNNKCTWTWTTRNYVTGFSVTGPNGNSIFLPAAGYRSDENLYDTGYNGDYWASSLYTSNASFARYVYFYFNTSSGANSHTPGEEYRCFGRSIRPVKE